MSNVPYLFVAVFFLGLIFAAVGTEYGVLHGSCIQWIYRDLLTLQR